MRKSLVPYKAEKILEVFKIALDELEEYRFLEFVFGRYHEKRRQHAGFQFVFQISDVRQAVGRYYQLAEIRQEIYAFDIIVETEDSLVDVVIILFEGHEHPAFS